MPRRLAARHRYRTASRGSGRCRLFRDFSKSCQHRW